MPQDWVCLTLPSTSVSTDVLCLYLACTEANPRVFHTHRSFQTNINQGSTLRIHNLWAEKILHAMGFRGRTSILSYLPYPPLISCTSYSMLLHWSKFRDFCPLLGECYNISTLFDCIVGL